MTSAEKLALVKVQVDSTVADATITAYLSIAADRILRRRYPFDATVTTMPTEYEITQCELAARMVNRMGAEGQTGHSENGVERVWKTEDDADILARVTPFAGVIVEAVET